MESDDIADDPVMNLKSIFTRPIKDGGGGLGLGNLMKKGAKKSKPKCHLKLAHECKVGVLREEYLKIDNGLMMVKFLHDEKRKKKLNPLECRRDCPIPPVVDVRPRKDASDEPNLSRQISSISDNAPVGVDYRAYYPY